MTFIEDLTRSLDARLEELRGEIEKLTRVREELMDNAASSDPPASPAGTAPAAQRRRRRQQTASATEVAPAGKLHRLLADSAGLSTATLAERANADPAQVLPLLREMEAAGRVRRTGQRRGTRWHAVASQEEWIEQRAAELAARSRG